MKADWRMAAAGSIGGAALAIVIVVGLARFGLFAPPASRTADLTIHNYLMAHPEVLVDMSNKLQAQQQAADDAARQRAVSALGDKAFFNPDVAFVTGPASAKTTFVEFFDYNCPYCRASNPAVESYYETHKNDVRFAFIEFPIKGPDSTQAARIALAARKQPDKYLAFHFALMRETGMADPASVIAVAKKVGLDLKKLQADEQDPSIDAAIAASHTLAQAANIDGTPAFIINGKIREGAINDKLLEKLVND